MISCCHFDLTGGSHVGTVCVSNIRICRTVSLFQHGFRVKSLETTCSKDLLTFDDDGNDAGRCESINHSSKEVLNRIMWNSLMSNNAHNDLQKEEQTALDSNNNEKPPPESFGYDHYGSITNTHTTQPRCPVRFQVVVWYVGPIDVVLGTFPMKFRLTVFWSAPTDQEHAQMATTGYGTYDASNKRVWKMEGRQRAYQKELDEIIAPGSNLVYVPPISILNAVDFSLVGEPEVCLVDEAQKRMKWTCMYNASLIQEDMRVTRYVYYYIFVWHLYSWIKRYDILASTFTP